MTLDGRATRDLGTYYVRVIFEDGRGYIEEWDTGHRYTRGTGGWSPLDADPISPSWEDEADLIAGILYQYLDGNYSCDCNKRDFLARAYQQPEPTENPCGETLLLRSLTLIRPDRSEELLWQTKTACGEVSVPK